MALLGKFDESYTRTGNSFFTKLANWSSFIPVVGGLLAGFFGTIGTAWEGIELLIQGKPLSAATAVAGGMVSNTVNTLKDIPILGAPLWWANYASGATTGRSIGTHARKLTEEVIGGVTGVLGVKPTILRSYPAGIGSIGGGMMSGPGQFASAEAQRRGQDPQAYYNSKMNSDMANHMAELESARGQPNYGGLGA